MTEIELQMLAADPTFEVTEVEPDPEEGTIEVKGKRTKRYGCVKYAGVPPENVIVSSRSTSVRPGDADFVEHWEYKSLSELRAEGYDVADDIGDESESWETETENRDRYGWDDENDRPAELRRVKVRECWLNFDEDGDGIAELRHVVVIGTTIVENEPCDMIPVAAWTPYIEAHQHIGQTVADQIMDLQRIKTSLMRVMIDSLYLQTHGRWAVTDRVNLDDMLVSRPGGIVRVEGALGGLAQDGDGAPLVVVYFPSVRDPAQPLPSVPLHVYRGGVAWGGGKLLVDGSPQGKTAYLTKPYLVPPPGQKADTAATRSSPNHSSMPRSRAFCPPASRCSPTPTATPPRTC